MFTHNLPLLLKKNPKQNKNPQTLQRVMVRNEVFEPLNNEVCDNFNSTKQNISYANIWTYPRLRKPKITSSLKVRKKFKKEMYVFLTHHCIEHKFTLSLLLLYSEYIVRGLDRPAAT
jgi:hypothetical protein